MANSISLRLTYCTDDADRSSKSFVELGKQKRLSIIRVDVKDGDEKGGRGE